MKVVSNLYTQEKRFIGTIVWDDQPTVQFPPFKKTVDEVVGFIKTVELIAIHRVQ